MQKNIKLIAIAGGSGSGKSWLARRLQQLLHPAAATLSLDDFYRDRATLPPAQRKKLNYDHPHAVDWRSLERVLRACRAGRPSLIPRYDFATHTRRAAEELFIPGPVVLVEGLWLLTRARVRDLLDFTIYLQCPTRLRLERRLERDCAERGRDPGAVRVQFWKSVAPMHERFVAPQAATADIVLKQPPARVEIENLAETIRALMMENEPRTPELRPVFWPVIAPPAPPSLETPAHVNPAREVVSRSA